MAHSGTARPVASSILSAVSPRGPHCPEAQRKKRGRERLASNQSTGRQNHSLLQHISGHDMEQSSRSRHRTRFGLTLVTTRKMRQEGDRASVPDDNVALLL